MAKFKAGAKSESENSPIIKTINLRPIQRRTQDIGTWRNALISAESINKNRKSLMELYEDVLLDGHLKSTVGKRITAITNTKLSFVAEGVDVPEISGLTEKPYFENLLIQIMQSKFHGYSLSQIDWLPYSKYKNVTGKNDTGETVLIDRRHVKPELGVVVANPNETTGVNYNEEPYVNFVVRSGNTSDFGLLLQAAQYAIYKRGGFGDYADFVEIFGQPFRTGTYKNPDDKDIIDSALGTMGSTGYAVVPEGTEIKQEYVNVSSGSELHDTFRKACNEEMSVTILGQTETTNSSDSSGYAQSMVHAQVGEQIHEDDRQSTLRILNSELTPVLEALGYPIPKDAKWVFVNSESTPLSERIKIDVEVDKKVPIGADYWYQTYRIEKPENYDELVRKREEAEAAIAAAKLQPQLAELSDTEAINLFDKFKRFFFKPVKLSELYNSGTSCGCNEPLIKLVQPNIKEAFDAFSKGVYDGDITKNSINSGTYKDTASALTDAVLKGYGNLKFSYDSPDNVMLMHLKSNVFAFSGAKNLEVNKQVQNLLFDGEGKRKTFSKFRDDVLKINESYNVNYLKTEQQTAVAQSRNASNWNKYERDKDIYPYLTYKTAGDNRVRTEHQRLDGFTALIDDSIWNKIAPPNGWNCRCSLRQSDKLPANNPTVTAQDINAEVPKYFQTNSGKTRMVFDENKHPYFINTDFKKLELNAVNNYGLPTTKTRLKQAEKVFKSGINSVEEYKAFYDAAKNEVGDIVYQDRLNNLVAFTEESNAFTIGKKQVKAQAYNLTGAIKDVLENADEIYSLHHNKAQTKATKLMQRYVRFYSDKAIVVETLEKAGKVVIQEYYEVTNLTSESYRSGVLM